MTAFGAEMKDNQKQILLRLSKSLYDDVARWAEDDFRSVNGQIEYLLTECVKRRRGNKEQGGGNDSSET